MLAVDLMRQENEIMLARCCGWILHGL